MLASPAVLTAVCPQGVRRPNGGIDPDRPGLYDLAVFLGPDRPPIITFNP